MSKMTLEPQVLREAQLVMLRILKQIDRVCRENQITYWLDSGTLLGAVRHQGFIPWDDDLDISMMRDDYEKFISIAPQVLGSELFVQNAFTDRQCNLSYTKVRDTNSLFVCIEEMNQEPRNHQGIFIDVFPMDKISVKGWMRYFWRRLVFKRIGDICGLTVRYQLRKLKQPFQHYFLKNCLIWFFKKCFGKPKYLTREAALKIENRMRKFTTVQSNDVEQFVVGYGLGLPFREVYRYDAIFPLQELEFEDATFPVPNNWDAYLRELYGDTYMTPPKDEKRKPGHAAYIVPV